jgi:hypothetical protein
MADPKFRWVTYLANGFDVVACWAPGFFGFVLFSWTAGPAAERVNGAIEIAGILQRKVGILMSPLCTHAQTC